MLLLCSHFALSQNTVSDLVAKLTPKPLPTSPEVAALGRFGEYPVNLYTGLPDISIPLYEIRSGSLVLPITLSYHASGIRYTQQATWVGLGWSLAAGGTISREVRGKKDEEDFLNAPLPVLNPCTDYYKLKDAVNGAIDYEADIYSYSFPGRSGKFFRKKTSSGIENIFFPYSPLNLSVDGSKYEIRNTDGSLYRFGVNSQSANAIEFTTGSVQAATAWHLMDIVSMNAEDQINLTYQSIGSSSLNDLSWYQAVLDQCHPGSVEVQCPYPAVSTANFSYANTSTSQVVLNTILFTGGKVDFIASAPNVRLDQTQSRFLDQIIVYANVKGVYTPVKYIKFNYSYFKNSNNTQNLRLKLDGIDITDSSQKVIQKYRFSYFSNNFSWDQPLYSNRRDFWDFYNGATGNTNLIPATTILYQELEGGTITNMTVGGATNRETNPAFLKEGVLKKITFPTGGYTEFDYENHKYFENGSMRNAGGLRVKNIISNDSKGSTTTRTYKYGLNECDYGEKNFDLSLRTFSSQTHIRDITIPFGYFVMVRTRNRIFMSNPGISMESGEGSPVVYNYVTEYHGDQTSNIGKTVYEYDNGSFTPDVVQILPASGKGYRASMAWARGKLTRRTTYDKFGNPVSEVESTFQTFKSATNAVGLGTVKKLLYPSTYLSLFFVQTCQEYYGDFIDAQEYGVTQYNQNSGVKLEISRKEKMYEQGNIARVIESVTNFTRDPNFLEITEERRTSSEPGTMQVKRTKYPFSYTYSGTESGVAKAMRLLKERNALSTPIEELSLLQRFDGSSVRVLSGFITEYVENQNNTAQIVPRANFVLETVNPIPIASFVNSSVSGNTLAKYTGYVERLTHKFDQFGNITQISKNSDTDVSYLWGYNNKLPIAEVTGALHKNVFHTSFEELTTGFSTSFKTGSQSKTGGFSQVISNLDPGTYFLSYFTWNGSAWVHTLSEHVVSGTSFTINLSGTIDEVRFYPKGSIMKTYTHKLPFGISSATDEHSLSSYYQYDDFGRLMLIKDDKGSILKTYQYNYVNVN